MNIKYFLLVLLALPFATITRFVSEPMNVYVTNNGQIDLMVNSVLIPANPMETDIYPIQSINNTLVISIPGQGSEHAVVVKLRDGDAGTTIQIGSHGDGVDVLRSDKIPVRFLLKNSRNRFPKKL